MIKFLDALFNRKKSSYTVTNDMRSLKLDRSLFRGVFLKQNILGFLSCLFVLFFSHIFKSIMLTKYFNIYSQIFFLLFFSLSMVFLALMLFQLNKQLLQWWLLGYIFCSLILFVDIMPLNNLMFYVLIVFSYVYLYFASIQYRKSDETYLRFDWKIVFRSGFHHQFIAVSCIFVAIIFFGFIRIDNKMIKGLNLNSFVKIGLDAWTSFKPDSSLNQSFDIAVNNFIVKNPIMNTFQKQYSFLGISGEKIITDSIKSMFENGFDGKTKLSQILVDYFNKASQATKTLVFGIFIWFILSIIGFFYFISRFFVYYLSLFIINILIWLKFLKFEEKPAVKQYLTM